MASRPGDTNKGNNLALTNPTWKGVLVIIGSIIVEFTLGSSYTLGNFSTYIISYMRVRGISPDILYTSSIWISASNTIATGFFMFVSGYLEKCFGPRITTLIAGWFFSGCIALTYFSVKYSFPCLILTYGFLIGIGGSIVYPVGLNCAMRWFPNKKATAVGVVLAGYGMAAFFWNPLITFYINPKNFTPNRKIGNEIYFSQPEVLDNVPSCFLVLGSSYAVILLLGALLTFNPKLSSVPASQTIETESDSNSESDLEQSKNEDQIQLMRISRKRVKPELQQKNQPNINSENKDYKTEILEEEEFSLSPREVLKTRQFYLLWFILFFLNQSIDFICTLYKAYGQTFIKNDHFLSMTGAFASIANASGRMLWGLIGDRFPFKKTMFSLLLILTFLLASLSFTEKGGKFMFSIWIFLIYLTFSGTFVLLPAITQKTFGAKHYLTNYGLVFTSHILNGSLGSYMTIELKKILGWHGMFFLSAGISSICAIFTCLFTELKPSLNRFSKTTTRD